MVGFDMKTEMAKFPLNMTNIFWWSWHEMEMAGFPLTWQHCGWIWHWERKWLHFRYMTAGVIWFDMEANMAEFSLTWCKLVVSLTWKWNWLNGNDWISRNMTMLWLDLTWKQKWLNFRYHDNVVVGFGMKTQQLNSH